MAMIRPDPSLSPPSGENRDKMVMAMMVQRQGYRRRSNLPIFHSRGGDRRSNSAFNVAEAAIKAGGR